MPSSWRSSAIATPIARRCMGVRSSRSQRRTEGAENRTAVPPALRSRGRGRRGAGSAAQVERDAGAAGEALLLVAGAVGGGGADAVAAGADRDPQLPSRDLGADA